MQRLSKEQLDECLQKVVMEPAEVIADEVRLRENFNNATHGYLIRAVLPNRDYIGKLERLLFYFSLKVKQPPIAIWFGVIDPAADEDSEHSGAMTPQRLHRMSKELTRGMVKTPPVLGSYYRPSAEQWQEVLKAWLYRYGGAAEENKCGIVCLIGIEHGFLVLEDQPQEKQTQPPRGKRGRPPKAKQ